MPRTLLLAGGVGGMLALSGPPLPQHALAALPAFFFSPLLLTLIREQRPTRAALTGLCAGIGFGLWALRFALDVLARFAGFGPALAWPTFLLLVVLQALPLALALGLARLADTPHSSRLHLTLPLALAGSFGVVPMLFPWHLGHFTLPWLGWAQVAELGGLPLVDLLTAMVGCCGLVALQSRSRRLGALTAMWVVGMATFGHLRLSAVSAGRSTAPQLPVGLVQPNITVAEVRAGLSPAARLAILERLSAEADAQGAELTLWPEAAYPLRVSRDALEQRHPSALAGLAAWRGQGVDAQRPPSDVRPGGQDDTRAIGGLGSGESAEAARVGARGRAPRVLGAMTGTGPCTRWNSLVVVDGAGAPMAHVDKRELFPFAEWIPLWAWSEGLQARFPCGSEQVGTGEPVVDVAGARVGLLNCHEDVRPGRAREATLAGARVLLNFSNDAWFGASVQPELHRIVARFRAIETRRDLVRVVNTGRSGHIAATGEERVVLTRHQAQATVVRARLLAHETLSVRLGDWVPPLALVLLVACVAERVGLARRRLARQSHDTA
ncbi:MAG: apolipoprotein N-acyltransferase [Polyangiales bacterium]